MYETISDPSNPFNKTGISREVRALLDYLEAGARAMSIDAVCTSTTDHPVRAASGSTSRHRQQGTDGEGLAIDCRLRQRGLDTHDAVFAMFRPVAPDLHELIYADAQQNVKAGRWVAPYAVSDHHDHVHVSVDRGVLVHWPLIAPRPTASTTLYRHEADMSSTLDHTEPLDSNGNAQWFTDKPWSTFISVEACHPVRPFADGRYAPGLAAQPVEHDGKVVVVITGGPPAGSARLMLTVSD